MASTTSERGLLPPLPLPNFGFALGFKISYNSMRLRQNASPGRYPEAGIDGKDLA